MSRLSFDQRLSVIGFRIFSNNAYTSLAPDDFFLCDIEANLVDAAYEALTDGRIFSLLFSWLKVHGRHIHIEKFFKIARMRESQSGHNPIINAMSVWCTLCGFHNFKRHIDISSKNEFLLEKEVTESFGRVQGFKTDFLKYNVKVPEKYLRIREQDVFTDVELAKENLQFRNRLLFGASWRADIITAIDLGARTPTEVCKKIGCSYEPSYRIFKEYKIAKEASRVA